MRIWPFLCWKNNLSRLLIIIIHNLLLESRKYSNYIYSYVGCNSNTQTYSKWHAFFIIKENQIKEKSTFGNPFNQMFQFATSSSFTKKVLQCRSYQSPHILESRGNVCSGDWREILTYFGKFFSPTIIMSPCLYSFVHYSLKIIYLVYYIRYECMII